MHRNVRNTFENFHSGGEGIFDFTIEKNFIVSQPKIHEIFDLKILKFIMILRGLLVTLSINNI